MHIAVLGTGMIGTTVVKEIVKYDEITHVTIVDGSEQSIERCMASVKSDKITGKTASLMSEDAIAEVLKDADLSVGCLPHSLSMAAIKGAIKAKCHLVDLVGSNYQEKKELDLLAKEAGVLIIPGCGVAPGITNFLAAQGIHMLDEADEAVMICGGIPRYPVPPLWYQIVFRLESVLGLYTKPAQAIEGNEIVALPPFSGLEKMTFPYPVGECEAVITDAHSTAYSLKDKVKRLYEKTVRYPGHWEKMKVLSELGYFDTEPIQIDGMTTTARALSEHILSPKLKGTSSEDITVVRVEVSGKKDGIETKYSWEMIDLFDTDNNITSMAKTTAIPASITAKWIAKGKITETGVIPIEDLIIKERFDPFLVELKDAGISINFTEEKLADLIT